MTTLRSLAAATLALALTAPAARAETPSLWTLLHPDRIAGQVLRSAILSLRTQLDLRYSALTVSLAEGLVAADDVTLVLYDNITGGDACDVAIAGLRLTSADPFDPDRLSLRITARGVTLAADCLPPETRPSLAVLGRSDVTLPEITLDLDYDVPSAGAEMILSAEAEGIAAVSLTAAFDYVTLWAGSGGEPELMGDLSRAALIVEDLGGWTRAAPLLPPPFTDPETAGAALTQVLGQQFDSLAAGGVVPKNVKTFATEAAAGWADFVASPGRLVVETGFDPAAPVNLDAATLEGGPLAVIDLLAPVVARVPRAERAALSPAQVGAVIDNPETADTADRRAVGLALVTGLGAPRAPFLGADILWPLIEAGDGEAALATARALAQPDPESAYSAALVAGAQAMPGARPLLDRLERDLPFATRLRLQLAAVPDPQPADLAAPSRELTARAAAHLTGVGAPRALAHAMLYASLAAASGDRAAARLLNRIDRQIPDDGWDAWGPIADEVSNRALEAWRAPAER